MKIVTSITFWNDAIGKRISATYSEVDQNGQVITDNNRVDRVVTDSKEIKHLDEIAKIAQRLLDGEEATNE